MDIDRINRRFRQHYYTNGKLKNWPVSSEFLLAEGSYPTKVKPGDLPPWYIGITYWTTRYVDTSRVSDVFYCPCGLPHHNHLFKDDYLHLWYDGDKASFSNEGWPVGNYETLWGHELIDGLFSVREYSGIDITEQLNTLRDKILRYNLEYREPYPDPGIPYDPDVIFAKAERDVQERKEAYESLHSGAHRP